MIQNIFLNSSAGDQVKSYGEYGTIFIDEFLGPALTPDWDQTGVNATFIPDTLGKLIVTRTSGEGLDDYVLNATNISTLENYKVICNYKAPVLTADTIGIAIGQQGARVAKSHIAGIRTDSGGALGELVIYEDNDFITPVYISPTGIAVTVGDVLEIEINFDTDKFTATARNITQAESITHTLFNVLIYPVAIYSRSGKTGSYGIYSVKGTIEVFNIIVTSSEVTKADYIVIGDSITERFAATSLGNSYQGRLQNALGGEWVTFAGGGNYTTEILSTMAQILKIMPDKALLFISTNDFAIGGRLIGDVQTDYSSIVSQLEAAGIDVILCENIPRSGQDYGTWNAWLASNFPSNTLIAWHDVMGDPVGSVNIDPTLYQDGAHPNDAGFLEMYNIALTALTT